MRPSHRGLDPRSKAVFVLVVVAVATVARDAATLAALGAVVLATVAAGRDVTLSGVARALAPFRFIVPVILVLNAVFYGGGDVLWGVSVASIPVTVTTGGIATAVEIALRLLVIAAAAAWFAAATTPVEFERGLVAVGVPWRLAFVFSLTLRLVPELRARFRDIEDAQRARGLDIGGGPVSQARARIPMFVPFLVAVIQYGYELADALEVRDFGATPNRTFLLELRFDRVDAAFALYAGAVLAAFAVVLSSPGL